MASHMKYLGRTVRGLWEDKDGDGIPDFMQQGWFGFGGSRRQDSLNRALSRNLMSIRGRKSNIRNIPIEILSTNYVEEESSAEDDTPILQNGVFGGQKYEEIKARYLAKKELFFDPLFPPCESSLYVNDSSHRIVWKRASEIVDDPKFFVGGASRFDINQGELGDCWLSAAIANLTMHKNLFEKVVPHNQSFDDEYAGIFRFSFWQYGEWIDVVVDDYLPTRHGRLLFMHSDEPNEFWSALLEKAYAKLHGSYESLRGGTTSEAFVDFSGGCSEIFDLKEGEKNSPRDIFAMMKKALKKNSMLACSIDPDPRVIEAKTPEGLIKGHAYSITKAIKAKTDSGNRKKVFSLIRIRNPWGNETEWKGAWADGSEEWELLTKETRKRHGITFENDGEFFMSVEDFFHHFDTLEICNLNADSVQDPTLDHAWHETKHNGSWISGSTAGGCRNYLDTFVQNPQFSFKLTDSDDDDDLCSCVIALMQKGTRKNKISSDFVECPSIGFAIWRMEEEEKLPLGIEFFKYKASLVRSESFVNMREVVGRFKLEPGFYVVIPSTFEPDQEADFLLRIFTEHPLSQ